MLFLAGRYFILSILIHAICCQTELQVVSTQSPSLPLSDQRTPVFYSKNFANCLGSNQSPIVMTNFQASLDMNNQTGIITIEGSTNLTSDTVMVFISIHAYGETRFEITWNPCDTGTQSLCPISSKIPIAITASVPLNVDQISQISQTATKIPDFEGQVILRIFSNTTENEIACYATAITNGHTFDQKIIISTILGAFLVIAIIASIITAVYGSSISEIRTHHAHSLSVLVVFAVFHHIYFTGALSMNWPKILVAFWSNYAWSAGMICIDHMQDAISKVLGIDSGNTFHLGAVPSFSEISNHVGEAYDISRIYQRSQSYTSKHTGQLQKRYMNDNSQGYDKLTRTGLPIPGNFFGFAGSLSQEYIPASNAFLTGLIWFCSLIIVIGIGFVSFKVMIELSIRFKQIHSERWNIFRHNWLHYMSYTLLKTCYIAFPVMIFLSIFQFTLSPALVTITTSIIIFCTFFLGFSVICAYVFWSLFKNCQWNVNSNKIMLEKKTILKYVPYLRLHRNYYNEKSDGKLIVSLPYWKRSNNHFDDLLNLHEDEEYLKKFGWLYARFRLSKWWFFTVWLLYEFIKACFLAGASKYALVQVYGILGIEIIALVVLIKIKPFEGQRLNVLMVYSLSFSKIITVALSSTFGTYFNISRTRATVIGCTIIMIQGMLTIELMILILLSVLSSYFSITRYEVDIKPRMWMRHREKYFEHITQKATENSPMTVSTSDVEEGLVVPKVPQFSVTSVRRLAKIEDEDRDFQREIYIDPRAATSTRISYTDLTTNNKTLIKTLNHKASVANSIGSTISVSGLPYAAVLHRGSWTTRDFSPYLRERGSMTSIERFSSDECAMNRFSRENLRKTPSSGIQFVEEVFEAEQMRYPRPPNPTPEPFMLE